MNKATLTKVAIGTVGVIAGLSAGLVSIASAQTAPTSTTGSSTQSARPMMQDGNHTPGTIASISGSTITLTGANGTTYTVDASSAAVKNGPTTTASLSDLKAGDKIVVEGTVSGSSISATEIHYGMMPGGMGGKGFGHGRGQGVMGTVSAISGSTITVTGKDGQTYTVNAGSATVGKTVSIATSDIKVGDTIGVQGSVSGTTVTAQHIMDGVPPSHQQ